MLSKQRTEINEQILESNKRKRKLFYQKKLCKESRSLPVQEIYEEGIKLKNKLIHKIANHILLN